MPVSRRERAIPLTKVKTKPKSAKSELMQEIRDMIPSLKYTYVIEVANDRNALLKSVRDAIKPGRIFMGKNKLMQLALGLDRASEIVDGISVLTPHITGVRGILLSNDSPAEVESKLSECSCAEFARTGCIAEGGVVLEAGLAAFEKFPHSIEAHLRKLGLTTALENGKIRLLQEFRLCDKGETLSNEQTQILKLLEIPMATFRVSIVASHKNK